MMRVSGVVWTSSSMTCLSVMQLPVVESTSEVNSQSGLWAAQDRYGWVCPATRRKPYMPMNNLTRRYRCFAVNPWLVSETRYHQEDMKRFVRWCKPHESFHARHLARAVRFLTLTKWFSKFASGTWRWPRASVFTALYENAYQSSEKAWEPV